MNKITLLVIVLALSFTKVNAQITFVKKYKIPLALSSGISIVEDVSGGYLFNGWSNDSLSDLSYTFLAKCDQLGSVVWVKYYDTLIFNASMKRFPNGDLLLAGVSSIMKLDNTGNEIWSRRISGTGSISISGFVISSDGGVVVSAINQDQADNSIQIFKLDSAGNLIWSMGTQLSPSSIGLAKIIETLDGGYLATFEMIVGNLGFQIFIIKTDSLGNMYWSKSFGSLNSDFVIDPLQCSDGNYLFAGYTSNATSAFKLDTAGALLWSKTYGSNSVGIQKVLEKTNGNLIFAGSCSDTVYNDFLLMETDQNGDVLYANSYSSVISGYVNDIYPTNDLGFIAIGNDGLIDPSIPSSTFNTIELIKTDSLLESACNFQSVNIIYANQSLNPHLGTYLIPGSVSSSSIVVAQYPHQMTTTMVCKVIGVDEMGIDDLIEIFPNPTTDKLTIEINSSYIQKISICNLTGKLIKTISCNNSNLEIDVSNLSPGIYFLNGTSDQGTFRKRFVKN